MASTISAGTTTTTALVYSADTSGVLQLQTNGTTTAVTIDTNQNVGVGVTPSAWVSTAKAFQINGGYVGSIWTTASGQFQIGNNVYTNSGGNDTYISTNYAAKYNISSTGQHQWYNAPSGTAGNAITFTQAMTLDASSNLLVGSSTSLYASGKLQISGGKTIINSTDNSFGQLQIGNATTNGEASIEFISGVTAFGGTPTSTSGNNFCWNIGAGNYSIGGDSFGVGNKGNGGINVKLAYNSSSWISVSDERIKNITANIENANQIIANWRTVYYTLKSDETNSVKIGLIAQDVQKTLPEVVDVPTKEYDDNNKLIPLGIHYSEVVPVLVAAIKEQQAMITTLQSQVTALKG